MIMNDDFFQLPIFLLGIVVLIVLLIWIAVQTSKVRKEAQKKILEEFMGTCTNCGSRLRTNYYYKGRYLSYCHMCHCGYKPHEILYNKEKKPYAVQIDNDPFDKVIINTDYIPKYITPEKCPQCGSESLYSDGTWGNPRYDHGTFKKCTSCGYSSLY